MTKPIHKPVDKFPLIYKKIEEVKNITSVLYSCNYYYNTKKYIHKPLYKPTSLI